MLQSKRIGNDLVAVSFGPEEIQIRKSGKENYNKERVLCRVENGALYVDLDTAKHFGMPIYYEEAKTDEVCCGDCKNLKIVGCYGTCGANHRGIVNAKDTCPYGEKR